MSVASGSKGAAGSGRAPKQMPTRGVAFQTDLASIGRSDSKAFSDTGRSSGQSIIEEERRLIEKVFSIVDKDNSGTIDTQELVDMFKLFGIEHHVTTAVSRIMSNVDKDHDGTISPQEFYALLSRKFGPGDSVKEITQVFDRMCTKGREAEVEGRRVKILTIDDLDEVAKMLGENMPRADLTKMVKMFSVDEAKYADTKSSAAKSSAGKSAPEEKLGITLEDFVKIMHEELAK